MVLLDDRPEEAPDFTGTTESFYIASGKGGQHRNKTSTACRLQHPSGITVTAERERSQWQNRQNAWAELERRLRAVAREQSSREVNEGRVAQIDLPGWTWTEWRDEVVDRISGKRARYSDLLRGRGFARMTP